MSLDVMPGHPGFEDRERETVDTGPAQPMFQGGMPSSDPDREDNEGVGNWDQEPARARSEPPRAATQHTPIPHTASTSAEESLNGGIAPLHQSGYKERFLAFAADARMGAQVLRVRTGVDAKLQTVRDSRPVTSTLSKVGVRKSAAANGVPCDPPDGVEADVRDLFNEEPALRQSILQFHDTQGHLDDLLPALQDYQRHREGLADAEQRIAIALQEAGMRMGPGALGQALQTCGNVHKLAATKRTEAQEAEEKNVTSVLRGHTNQAGQDCKQAVQSYEASRHELRLLYDAREKARGTKQQMMESGANKVDSKLAPHVNAAMEQAEEQAKERLVGTSEAVTAKLAMLRAKHQLDYATALSHHMNNLVQEEQGVQEVLGTLGDAIATIQDSAMQNDLVM